MKNKKIIFFSSYDSTIKWGGPFLRNQPILEIYKELGFNVTVVYRDQLELFYPVFKKIIGRFYYNAIPLFESVKSIQDLSSFDAIHFDTLKCFSWNKGMDIPLILNSHNLEFEFYHRVSNSKYFSRLKNYEYNCMSKASLVLVCTEREKRIIVNDKPSLSEKVIVIPNMVNSKKYIPDWKNKNIISFIGSMNYPPNILAINWLIDNFIKEFPSNIINQFKWIIAGANPSKELEQKIKNSPFTLMKNVSTEEMLKVFSQSKIFLVPLERGAGSRLKIIEALFSGCKVISTPLGAEGFESKNLEITNLDNFKEKFLATIKSYDAKIEEQQFQNLQDKVRRNWDWNFWPHNEKQKISNKLNTIFK